jgi:hypothetical protein
VVDEFFEELFRGEGGESSLDDEGLEALQKL